MVQQKRKRLFLMSGVAGVGKSTFILNHISEFGGVTQIVSRDAIRFELIEEGDEYFSKEHEVWSKFIKEIQSGLDNPYVNNVIIDATHLSKGSRKKILNAIGMNRLINIEVNIICLVADLEFILNNNNKRNGLARVPDSVIKNMYNSFQLPSYREGFHYILIINSEKESKYK